MIELKHALGELEKVSDMIQLDNFFQIYLGKKGLLNEEFKLLIDLPPQDKKDKGVILSDFKTKLTVAYEQKQQYFMMQEINQQLEKDLVDISLDVASEYGSYSLLAKVRREIEEVYTSLGCRIDYGHEMVTPYENFESIDIPLSHPATEMYAPMYLNDQDPSGEHFMLRTHHFAHQVQAIQTYGVPLRLGSLGRVYTLDRMDALHDVMVQSADGMVIDKNISIAQCKDTMQKLLSGVLGKSIKVRLRPRYFPFFEPGFAIDAQCPGCDGKGCDLCKGDGRIALLGAGMIHPNVLIKAGLDPKEWSGFARGIGVNRLTAIKYSIKDIRYFTNGDLRFAKSFA